VGEAQIGRPFLFVDRYLVSNCLLCYQLKGSFFTQLEVGSCYLAQSNISTHLSGLQEIMDAERVQGIRATRQRGRYGNGHLAFGKIVTSLVNDVIMPPIGLILGRGDFSRSVFQSWRQTYQSLAAAKAVGAPTIKCGTFLNTVLDFLIVAFLMFLVVRQLNRFPPAGGSRSDDQRMPVLRRANTAEGVTVSELHVRSAS